MTSYLDSPTHRSRFLVVFKWDTNTLRVTDWEEAAAVALLGTFSAMPGMEVKLPPNTTGLDETSLKLVLPKDGHTLFANLSIGRHAPVDVRVYEEILTATGVSTAEILYHYRGVISKAIRNYNNRRDLVMLEALSVKSQLRVPLGLPCNSQCVWQLGDQNCQAEVQPSSHVVNSVSRNQLELVGVTPTPTDVRYWERGWIEVESLRIGIRKWNSAAQSTFHLVDKPPADWATKTARIFPGCDKSITTCRARFSNEEYFGGFGFAIPAYNPNFQTPSL